MHSCLSEASGYDLLWIFLFVIGAVGIICSQTGLVHLLLFCSGGPGSSFSRPLFSVATHSAATEKLLPSSCSSCRPPDCDSRVFRFTSLLNVKLFLFVFECCLSLFEVGNTVSC